MTAMALALDRRFYGVVVGIVEEIVDPDKEGRIQVSFPWYDEGMITEWCRMCQLYAGSGYGSFFVPEIGDEVLVAFVQGDMRLPIIMGGLYNGKDKPPTDRQEDDDKNHKLIRTKAGHSLLFDDTKDKEKIVLTTKGGHVLELHDPDKDGEKFVKLRTKKGHELKLDDKDGKEKATLTSKNGHSLTLDDGGSQVVLRTSDGKSSVTMDAGSGDITVVGTTIKLGSAASEHMVLGDKLMALFNTHTHALVPGATDVPNQQMDTSQLSSVAKVE
jgi:uncharacterized protein involved in type VI secretion and phage assembly